MLEHSLSRGLRRVAASGNDKAPHLNTITHMHRMPARGSRSSLLSPAPISAQLATQAARGRTTHNLTTSTSTAAAVCSVLGTFPSSSQSTDSRYLAMLSSLPTFPNPPKYTNTLFGCTCTPGLHPPESKPIAQPSPPHPPAPAALHYGGFSPALPLSTLHAHSQLWGWATVHLHLP